MAVPVARVHLAMEHAALPPLLPAPPNCKMLPLLPTPPCVATIILPKPHANEPSRADSDERWDAHKTRPASAESTASSRPRSFSCGAAAGRRSTYRMNATSPPRPGLAADSAERWDAHKKAAATPASSSSGTSSLKGSTCTISRSRASSMERRDAHKKAASPSSSSTTTSSSSSGTSFLKGSPCTISRSRASSTERWDADKKAASPASSSSSCTSFLKGSPCTISRSRASSTERWDAHKKAASPASSSSSCTSSLKGSPCTMISRSGASCTERWDAHEKRRCPPQAALLDDDGERSSTGSNDNIETEEEIVWKPRATAIYAEPCFISTAPEPSMLPMPTAFLFRVA
ncbi:hypothetical protein ZEAMMB73_Zm00001d052580 [Zea mays]|uniref:Uncharacterized protein n=1 Tax=Zea mays TaxID=4577 RepID=K7UMC6_MAIZE|nr:hypothetical protein ZEAMMB73_Zm00001d052580 [Zea mays]|eukprot:XP_008680722.1 putative protein TPRXL [Zea mays]